MKNTHICPKCNSSNIVKVSDNEGFDKSNRYNIKISSLHTRILKPILYVLDNRLRKSGYTKLPIAYLSSST